MANLVIIESPYKAPTIKNYLGSNYKVVASKGHLRDLPKSTLGVDIENGFEAHYINIRGKGDIIKELKKEAKNASKVYFATDPDREGEAISWHLANVLGIPIEETKRITFNELTKSAIKASIKEPRNIDIELVNSQQARRILDRIVGYKLSPFLWKTVRSGLSAGRVQSVATRIIVEREREIRAFVPVEYWTVDALLENAKGAHFTAHFYGRNGEKDRASHRRGGGRDRGCCREPGFHRHIAEKVCKKPESRTALHHLHAAAGGIKKAGLPVAEDNEGRTGALRGHQPRLGERRRSGSYHLHENRLPPRLLRGGGRG